MAKVCKIKGCDRQYYSKGYCHLHYQRLLVTGSPNRTLQMNKGKVCKAPGCDKSAAVKGYCPMHYERWRQHHSLKARPRGARGKKNGNWKGGTSEYRNHYLMKKNRLIRLKEEEFKCEFCGKKTNLTFHRDCSKDNHSLANLSVACKRCGLNAFRKPNSTSKYQRKYGMTLEEMALRYGGYTSKYFYKHQKGMLSKYLAGKKREVKK